MSELAVFDTVVFDLDGTLLDSLEDLRDSANYALDRMGFPPRTTEEVRQFVGNGVGKLIERAVPQGTPPEQTQQCLAFFRAYYNKHMDDKTEPYPGIAGLLSALKEQGYKTAVVSNKYDGAVKRLCAGYFGDRIDTAVGEKENVRRKPAPDSVFEALRLLESSPEHTVYIGDSDVDMETAKNAGVVSIGVTWGFRGEDVLKRSGADHLASAPERIWDILKSQNCGTGQRD